MTSSPQKRIYARLKIDMKSAYYTDTMVSNLENFRAMAETYLTGPGECKSLPFLEICEHLEGKGCIGWHKLEILKELAQTATSGKEQLLIMINNAEKKIQEALPDLESCLPPERDAQNPRMRGEKMEVYMKKDVFRVKENHTAFLECRIDPVPIKVVWKKGEETHIEERIVINNKKYFGAGPSSPALVIREAEKTDEAYYQCTAKGIGIKVKGKAVPLEVEIVASDEDRGRSIHQTRRFHSSSDGYRYNRWRSRSPVRHRESCSRSPEDRYQGKPSTRELQDDVIQIVMSGCQMTYTISNHKDIDILSSLIRNKFQAATDAKQRIDELAFKKKCIQVFMTIKPANNLSEAPAVCLAEQFKRFILDVGLQLSEESNDILEVDEASIKITPEHMPKDGLPLVIISHQQWSVPQSEPVILQTYIISSPQASSIEWFKITADDDDVSIKIDSKKYYGGSELSPSLIIRNISVDDQGWYICRATNTNGTGCSNKTFVGISSESAGAEDEPGTILTDISDIQESPRADDEPGTIATDISDISESTPAEDKPGTVEADTSDIKDSTREDDKPGTIVTDISHIQESTPAEDKPGTVEADISDIKESTRADDKPGKMVTDISDIQERSLKEFQLLRARQRLRLPIPRLPSHQPRLPSHLTDHQPYDAYVDHPMKRAPSPPRSLQVTHADRTSLTISWTPPLENIRKSPLTEYIVEKRTAWAQVSKVPAEELTCVADKLIEDTEYEFRITAVNKYGNGKALESDRTYMAKSPYKPLQTRDSPESTETDISDIKDLVPIDVWVRVPSQTEIRKIVTNIDSNFSNLFLELGLLHETIDQHGQGHPVTFQVRMEALLRCWIDSFQTKATIGRLLTAMKLCHMDSHTTAKIWSV